jgi:hypothetical protein
MSNPTTGIWPLASDLAGSPSPLTGSGAVRYSGGLWLEQAATNEFPNPSVESALTVSGNGAIAWSTATVTRVTDALATGTYCAEVSSSTGGSGIQWFTAHTATGDHVATADVWLVSGGSDWRAQVYDNTFTQRGSTVLFTPTGAKQRIAVPLPSLPAHTQLRLVFARVSNTLGVIRSDAMQIESGLFPTSYADSSLGTGYSTSPSPHSRAASSASLSPSGILSPSNGAIAMRVTPTIETGVEEIWFECGVKGSGTDHFQGGRDASKHPFIEWSSNNASYQRLTASETWNALAGKTLYLGWNGTSAYLQVDSGTLQSASRDAVSASWGAGNIKLQASKGGNIITPFSAYSEHLNDTDRALVIASIAAGGSNLATVLDDAAAPLRTLNIRTNALLRQ